LINYKKEKLQSTKLWLNALWCGSDVECLRYNPDGVPTNGWTVCNSGVILNSSMGMIFLSFVGIFITYFM